MAKQETTGLIPHPGVGEASGKTAVYRLSDSDGRLLYVGIGWNPMRRWAAHAEQHAWWPDVTSFEVAWHATRQEAAAEERRALREDDPLHNIHGTARHGLVTGAGVRRALGGRRNFSERSPEQDQRAALVSKE